MSANGRVIGGEFSSKFGIVKYEADFEKKVVRGKLLRDRRWYIHEVSFDGDHAPAVDELIEHYSNLVIE